MFSSTMVKQAVVTPQDQLNPNHIYHRLALFNQDGTPYLNTYELAVEELQGLVDDAIAALVDGAPEALDKLNELSAALGDDPNFSATILADLAGKEDVGVSVPIVDAAHNTTILTSGGGLGNGWLFVGVSGNADQGLVVQNVTPGATATTYVQAANDDRSAGVALVTTSSVMNEVGLIHPSLSMLEADTSELLIFTSDSEDIIFAVGGFALADEVLRLIAASGKVRIGGATGALLSSGAAGRLDLDGALALGGTCVLAATGTRFDLPGNLLINGPSVYLVGGASRLAGGSEVGASDAGMAIYFGSGAPNNASGNNNEYYYRADGTHAGLTCIYHKEAGVWVGIA